MAPNFANEFKLAVDASDTGAGSALMQEDGKAVDHLVSYSSKKFNKHQKNYSTAEKECLSLILALQHFEVYVTFSSLPGRVAQSVGHLTRKSGILGSIPGLATYFRFSFSFFKKSSCQLLAKVCARSTG